MKRIILYLVAALMVWCLMPIEATTFKPPTQSTGSVSNKKPRAKRKHASSASAKRQCWQCGESKGLDAFDENSDICWSCYTENLKAQQEYERQEAERQRAEAERRRQQEAERQRQEAERQRQEAERQRKDMARQRLESDVVSWEFNRDKYRTKTFTVGKVSFTMVAVAGGTFAMGATSEQGDLSRSNEVPAHPVALNDYWIGETEVTEALWKAVMGKNPSKKKKGDNYPVENVTWDDCQTFIRKLYEKTGVTFCLPTEAEWEFAARGGNKSKGYKYAGGDNVSHVAWYWQNSGEQLQNNSYRQYSRYSTDDIYGDIYSENAANGNKCAKHPVAKMMPNELGIYDMSGNVSEWCSDWYSDYKASPQTTPSGPISGTTRVVRGGSWTDGSGPCRVSARDHAIPSGDKKSTKSIGLRLVCHDDVLPLLLKSGNTNVDNRVLAAHGSVDVYVVNGVPFNMVNVKGGTFTMGADSGREKWYKDEKPTHQVTLNNYCIGQTEVTERLWLAVMGTSPGGYKGVDYPVSGVSWDDCKTFISKLNSMTGETFRLPTEAEWEFAARGGNKSKGYKYPGGNNLSTIAWYWQNSGNLWLSGEWEKTKVDNNNCGKHPVASMLPNELGIYDMGGNLSEWCADWYGEYSSRDQTNPKGPSTGTERVIRGINYYWSNVLDHYVSYRYKEKPSAKYGNYGFRLAK